MQRENHKLHRDCTDFFCVLCKFLCSLCFFLSIGANLCQSVDSNAKGAKGRKGRQEINAKTQRKQKCKEVNAKVAKELTQRRKETQRCKGKTINYTEIAQIFSVFSVNFCVLCVFFSQSVQICVNRWIVTPRSPMDAKDAKKNFSVFSVVLLCFLCFLCFSPIGVNLCQSVDSP